MAQHLVVTGPIAGHVDTRAYDNIPADSVDCTPDVIVCADDDMGYKLLDAIDRHIPLITTDGQREATYAQLGA